MTAPNASAPSLDIAIIGAGFSGLMTAYHLVRNADRPLTIHLINERATFGKGAAYSTASTKHLLNVPAARMSALDDRPNHFLDWAHQQPAYRAINKDLLGRTFLPRQVFGAYVASLWDDACANKRADTQINIVYDTATTIEQLADGRLHVQCKQHAPIASAHVVLATGNEAPSDPRIAHPAFYQSPQYVKNPWLTDVTTRLPAGQDILIIGNGLTTVELIITLMDSHFAGTIHTLSPSGFCVLPHRHNHLRYDEYLDELGGSFQLETMLALGKKHAQLLRDIGISIDPLVDSLRSSTQTIWQSWSLAERERFLRDIKSQWSKIRNRLAPQLHDYVQLLRLKGRLVVHKARLIDIVAEPSTATVQYQETRRDAGPIETLAVGLVINCTGPRTDITQSEDPLLQSLVAKGMIRPDALRLGMDTTEHWTLIDIHGQENPRLHTLGSNLRGLLWETIAIPELKTQAQQLAMRLLGR